LNAVHDGMVSLIFSAQAEAIPGTASAGIFLLAHGYGAP
jgi:hypothetical protein